MLLEHIFNRLQWFSILIWALVPPLGLLLIYHRRVRAAPPLSGAMVLFWLGMLAGLAAWAIEWVFDLLIQTLPLAMRLSPQNADQHLVNQVLWQTAVIAPVAEASKIVAVIVPLQWLIKKYRRLPAQPSTVLLATIAASLGFAAQMSLVTLWYGRLSVIHVLLMFPMQVVFSMSWGCSLGFALCRTNRHLEYSTKLTIHGWLAACLCHGAWNGIVELSRGPGKLPIVPTMLTLTPEDLLYLLFPWGLWLWWQTEQMLARSQGDVSPRLVNGQTPLTIAGQYVAVVACLLVGGAGLNSLRNFGRSLNITWQLRMTFDQAAVSMLGQDLLKTLIFGAVALVIFQQLKQHAR